MNTDLSKVKVGDKIWTIQEGWTKVAKIDHSYNYPIRTENDYVYLLNGTLSMSDKYPSAFLECPFKEERIEKDTFVWFRDGEKSDYTVKRKVINQFNYK